MPQRSHNAHHFSCATANPTGRGGEAAPATHECVSESRARARARRHAFRAPLQPTAKYVPATMGVPDIKLMRARPRSEFQVGPKILRLTCTCVSGCEGVRVCGGGRPWRGHTRGAQTAPMRGLRTRGEKVCQPVQGAAVLRCLRNPIRDSVLPHTPNGGICG